MAKLLTVLVLACIVTASIVRADDGGFEVNWDNVNDEISKPSELDEVGGTKGIAWDGTSFWVGSDQETRVFQYDADWKYVGKTDLSGDYWFGGNVNDITADIKNKKYYVQSQTGRIYRFDFGWKNGECFAACAVRNAGTYGITNDDDYLYTHDANSLTYQYSKSAGAGQSDGRNVNSTPHCGSCRGGAFDGTYFYFWDYNGPNYLRQYKADESYTGVRWQTFPSGDGLGMTFSKVHCAIFLNDRARIWKFQGIGCPVITTTTVTATTTTTATITTTTTTTTLTTPTKEGNNDISARLDEVAADVTNLNAALDKKASTDSMATQNAAVVTQLKALADSFDRKLQAQDKALADSFELKLQAQEQTINRLKAELQEMRDAAPCAKFEIEANSDGVAVCTMKVDAVKSLRDN